MKIAYRMCHVLVALLPLVACNVEGPKCRGEARACSLLSDFQCDDAAGCFEDGRCSGVVPACSSNFSRTTCNAQLNCFWSAVSNSCQTATFVSCSTFPLETTCERYEGCYYIPSCTGVAYSCDLLDDSLSCGQQPGCAWE
jgi:hypothetical protein